MARKTIFCTLKGEPKPLMRGWFHALGAVAAAIFTAALVAAGGEFGTWSLALFGFAMVMLFSVSAVYHLGDGHWSRSTARVLRKLDHSTIFFFIASTFTPICAIVLDGVAQIAMLSVIWSLAVLGVLLTLSSWNVPRALKTGLYVGMGWSAAAVFPLLAAALSWVPVVLMAVGGTLYTVGAVIYARKRPNPIVGVLGFHEVFHAFTLGATATFAAVIYIWVAPLTFV